jgi:hypothetical protein
MCWRAFLCVTALLILSLFYSPPRLAAQAITGDILGTVKDPNGAVVPDAKVVLAEMATGITLTAMTDDSVLNHTQSTDYNRTISFSGLTNPVPTNLPFDSCGNLVNAKNGFGAVNGVRSPRIMQLVAPFVF